MENGVAKKGTIPRIVADGVVRALWDVFVERRYADKAVEHAFKQHPKWGSRDRRLFAESLYEIVRWWRWYWYLAGLPDEEHAQREGITEPRLWEVWAAYWLTQGRDLPFFEELNHVRRGAVMERAKLAEEGRVPLVVREAFPDWLDARAGREMGDKWPATRKALNEPAAVYLRVNTLKTDRRTLKLTLAQEGVAAEIVAEIPSALVLRERANVFNLKSFREGLFEVQDAASQRVAPFLEVEPGMRVIDSCAGGGGKTLHLAALMRNKGRILALDVHDWKLAELRRRAKRAGVDVAESRVIEGTKTIKRLAEDADRVLLDVPCSGLGVLRRNPDAKWKLSEEEIERLIVQQREILERYSAMVRPGGKLVYATCSILPSENELQVQAFLQTRENEWRLEEELRLNPAETGFDGFYAARLARIPQSPRTEDAAAKSQE